MIACLRAKIAYSNLDLYLSKKKSFFMRRAAGGRALGGLGCLGQAHVGLETAGGKTIISAQIQNFGPDL